ncbi:quinoprotein relay system zinc metallohydrolase 2 [Salipiger manganoxidans]|uniref:quinoprotein relay system zinc metallohydrolase 2 n=1 Tax=Salipiger marinus TaxID=555512 RepID=UPI001E5F2B20|nr:quinoprotein relay system zinc metallohydrolase 2 [Salipiger manganoxidans]MCD1620112.1 quinoprotein relay system zinc metallohydrolase 2 [Salipiger manganoxidans]
MFEAILTLCLAAGEPCRPVLLPGHEAPEAAACAASLATAALPDWPGLVAKSPPDCQPVAEPLTVTEIAPGVFVHTGQVAEPEPGNAGDVANLAFVIGSDSVAVIDSGSSRQIAERLWRAIRVRTDLPVRHVILTHMHPDHVFGATLFAETGAEVIGHASLSRALADRADSYTASFSRLLGPGFLGSALPQVTRGLDQIAELDLGGRVLDLRPWPVAHSGTDLTVFDRQSGILFAGDLVFDDHTPALDGSLTGWQQVLEDLAALPVTRLVPGHGGPVLDWPEGAAPQRRYLEVLARDTRAAIAAGERLGQAIPHVAASEAGQWRLFDTFNPRNATQAFTELEWE